MKYEKFPPSHTLYIPETLHGIIVKQTFRIAAAETPDHG
jgi:hypothetical protein